MTTELTRYNGNRYVLRKGQSVTDDADQDYIDAAAKLEKTYWGHELKGKQIAFLSASLGAEMYIEYDSVRKLTNNMRTTE
ncbi:hypothetical protein [Burkholderia sp. S171]|uniref:hypothetical protein n=1 Tax=Burkholderia sp. S171 TaxID=1641860 RepID=UPI00131ECEF5|nr:hypothetical protein [Burkholderia sp. S171]